MVKVMVMVYDREDKDYKMVDTFDTNRHEFIGMMFNRDEEEAQRLFDWVTNELWESRINEDQAAEILAAHNSKVVGR